MRSWIRMAASSSLVAVILGRLAGFCWCDPEAPADLSFRMQSWITLSNSGLAGWPEYRTTPLWSSTKAWGMPASRQQRIRRAARETLP